MPGTLFQACQGREALQRLHSSHQEKPMWFLWGKLPVSPLSHPHGSQDKTTA